MTGDAFGTVAEYIANMACEAARYKFKGKIDEFKLKKTITDFTREQIKYQETALLCEEFDYQGLFDYITSNFTELLECRCFSNNPKLRGQARTELVSMAGKYCKANSDEARKKVSTIVYNCLDIIKHYYSSQSSLKDYVLAGEIVEGVTEVVDERLRPVQNEISEISKNVTSLAGYSLENYARLAKEGNLSEIQSKLDNTFYIMSKEHPLYSEYGYQWEGKALLSRPLTLDAEKKYPPKYFCNGVLYLGGQMINQEDARKVNIIDYADRHQLQLALELHDVIKMLGETEDPSQVEAKALEGKMIVREPKEFPDALPCAISVNQEVMFEYLELRIKEILDDGTYIVDNREQRNSHVFISIKTKLEENGNVDFTLNIDRASNAELYQYVRFMKAVSKGAFVELKVLSIGKKLCSGFISTSSYNCRFSSIDEELQFLKDVCDVEEYIGDEIEIPENITGRHMQELSYLAGLVRGEEQAFWWQKFSIEGIVDENFRQRII